MKKRFYFTPGKEKKKKNLNYYFHSKVTSDWWSDIWFNEGMSSLFEIELVENVKIHFKIKLN